MVNKKDCKFFIKGMCDDCDGVNPPNKHVMDVRPCQLQPKKINKDSLRGNS